MDMKTRTLLSSLTLLLFFALQTAPLELRLTRDWGYGGLDNKIEGTFSMHADGPEDLVEVRFRVDGAVVNIDTEAPFRYQFETGQFDPGLHDLSATGLLASGEEMESNTITRHFLSEEEASAETRGLVAPLLVVVGVIAVLGVVLPLLGRNKQHKPGVYGPAGGAVCRRCAMPFSRSVFAPNLLLGKLERCPHCGKWAIVPRASAQALAEAEERLAAESGVAGVTAESEKEKQARLLDESRYDD